MKKEWTSLPWLPPPTDFSSAPADGWLVGGVCNMIHEKLLAKIIFGIQKICNKKKKFQPTCWRNIAAEVKLTIYTQTLEFHSFNSGTIEREVSRRSRRASWREISWQESSRNPNPYPNHNRICFLNKYKYKYKLPYIYCPQNA